MRKTKAPPVPTEYQEQVSVFKLAQIYCRRYPELRFLAGSLSGIRISIGLAVKCKRAGCLNPGQPDLFLPVRRSEYSGLYIELKRIAGGKIDPEQRVWEKFLTEQGFKHEFCSGGDAAWKVIVDYLES